MMQLSHALPLGKGGEAAADGERDFRLDPPHPLAFRIHRPLEPVTPSQRQIPRLRMWKTRKQNRKQTRLRNKRPAVQKNKKNSPLVLSFFVFVSAYLWRAIALECRIIDAEGAG
jgi:hypothetical protein